MPPQRPVAPLAFISYRSSDEPWAAISLRNALAARFGTQAIFIDAASVDPGEDFRPALLRAVVRSSALLVVIGRHWLAPSSSGHRPLDDETDWVRTEIALALFTCVPVLPVLVGDAEPPQAHQLPEDLKPLAYHQHIRLHPRDSDRDLQWIADRLEQLTVDVPTAPRIRVRTKQ